MSLDPSKLSQICQSLSADGEEMGKSFDGFFASLMNVRKRITRFQDDVVNAAGGEKTDCDWLSSVAGGLNSVSSRQMSSLIACAQMRDMLEQRLSHAIEGVGMLNSTPDVAQPPMARVLSAQVKSISETLSEASADAMACQKALAEGVEAALAKLPDQGSNEEGSGATADNPDLAIKAEADSSLQALSGDLDDMQKHISGLAGKAEDFGSVAPDIATVSQAGETQDTSSSMLDGLTQLYTSPIEHEVHRTELLRMGGPS